MTINRIILFILSAASVSCGAEEASTMSGPHRVEIRFTDGVYSRAFFDENASGEPWENTINNLSILVYDLGGDLKFQYDLSGEALSDGIVELILPESFGGKAYDFYAIANHTIPYFQFKTVEKLLSETDTSLADHNGAFDEMIGCGLSSKGFAMSGHCRSAIDVDGVTVLDIAMVRTVAKIALRTTLDPDFAEQYPGELTITSVTVLGCVARTSLIAGVDRNSPNCSFTQLSRIEEYGRYDNLFYLFASPSDCVKLIFDGIYDESVPVQYSVTLEDKVLRNTFYRIGIKIKGLSKADADLMPDVADWGYPITVEDRFI